MGKVGAGILNIITESLYDKPIVVFREYVQNSVDSFRRIINDENRKSLICDIWEKNGTLYFLDNGAGIQKEKFNEAMVSIAASGKIRTSDMGYKGIGRLSGVPYCKKVDFINICDSKQLFIQKFSINGEEYIKIKNSEDYSKMDIDELMKAIGEFSDMESLGVDEEIRQIIIDHSDMFEKQNTGFLVVLRSVSEILKKTLERDSLKNELEWLLPVDFLEEVKTGEKKELFKEFCTAGDNAVIPAQCFNVKFRGEELRRPIKGDMLRHFLCKADYKYAVGFHSFNRDKIAISKSNDFSGIRVYLDNMLLCDENELIPMLRRYGLIEHTVNETLQTVKGVGAMIYITDKVSISANARRTFIEVTDGDSLEFLRVLANFVESIYAARYALSKYISARKDTEVSEEKYNSAKENANQALRKLASDKIEVEDRDRKQNFSELSETEKKQVIKKKITKEINDKVKAYLSQAVEFDLENAFDDFKTWMLSN